jgi:hypothetical protein
MIRRSVLALAALTALASSEAQAAPRNNQNAKARQQFSALVAQKAAVVRTRQEITDLNPAAVARYDQRLTRYLNRFGVTPPPATNVLPEPTINFRRFFNRARFTPGATVGGVFFTTSGTPSVPGNAVNVFQFFPVFRLFGITQ